MQSLHESLRKMHERRYAQLYKPTLRAVFEQILNTRPNIILLWTYPNHYPTVREVAISARGADSVASLLQYLDQLPVPDFNDFPWHGYSHRMISTMTGRRCSWGI